MGISIDLTGKRALVCGASKGIGAETAIAMAEAGANVTLVARSIDGLRATLERMPAKDKHHTISLDLMDTDSIVPKVTEALEQTGDPYEILVCNTGGPKAGPLKEAELEELQSGFRGARIGQSKVA